MSLQFRAFSCLIKTSISLGQALLMLIDRADAGKVLPFKKQKREKSWKLKKTKKEKKRNLPTYNSAHTSTLNCLYITWLKSVLVMSSIYKDLYLHNTSEYSNIQTMLLPRGKAHSDIAPRCHTDKANMFFCQQKKPPPKNMHSWPLEQLLW